MLFRSQVEVLPGVALRSVHCPPLIWIKAKGVPESKYLITRFSEYDKVTITFERNVYTTNLRVLSEDFTYLDGSPCGIEE